MAFSPLLRFSSVAQKDSMRVALPSKMVSLPLVTAPSARVCSQERIQLVAVLPAVVRSVPRTRIASPQELATRFVLARTTTTPASPPAKALALRATSSMEAASSPTTSNANVTTVDRIPTAMDLPVDLRSVLETKPAFPTPMASLPVPQ
jgi:hypothetical protein